MKKLLLTAALMGSTLLPAAASAQALPGAVIAVVDLQRVTSECNACKTAQAALKSQVATLQSREKDLGSPLQSEAQSIQAAIDALKGGNPDAALQNRIKAFQAKQQAAQKEMQQRQQELERNQAYIQQQIGTKLGPIYEQVMTQRGANLMVEAGSTLATARSVDVSNDVLAALNASMPTLATTAPAAAKSDSR